VPIHYVIAPGARTIRTKCVGPLTLPEVIDHFQTLAIDPQCADGLNVFLDLSEVSTLPNGREILAVVTELKRIRTKTRFNACAILAPGNALFGMMRVFEAQAEEFFRITHTFRTATDAETWFALQTRHVDTPAAHGSATIKP
jgi:hypothetical protein